MKYILSFLLGATVIYYSGSSCSEKKVESSSKQGVVTKREITDSYDSAEEWNKKQVAEILGKVDYKIQKIKDLLDLGPQTPEMLGLPEGCYINLHSKNLPE